MLVTILGSTGTIGKKAVEICERLGFEVLGLACNSNIDLLYQQIVAAKPKYVAIADPVAAQQLKHRLSDLTAAPQLLVGENAACELAAMKCDRVVAAMVGFIGLLPVISAIEVGNDVALANKETLIAAGEIILPLAEKHQVDIIPVDSEHSAIFQCLAGNQNNKIKKILLTASGGPFRNFTMEQLTEVTAKDALAHPIWAMGSKITIDSATMMNKGLELIEACHLFSVRPDQVEVIVHPQSIMHSAVEFADGGVIAQLGVPDMYLPIQLALTWPLRQELPVPPLDIFAQNLEFLKPDFVKFPALRLATEAIKIGGTMPCIMNAANEIAVQAFLDAEICFLRITEIIEQVMDELSDQVKCENLDLNDVIEADVLARQSAKLLLS